MRLETGRLNAACSGGVLGLITALSFIAAGTAERVLLIASDTVTHHLADDDAHTRILFGDGAAAFLIEACSEGIALRSWVMGSDGGGGKADRKSTRLDSSHLG